MLENGQNKTSSTKSSLYKEREELSFFCLFFFFFLGFRNHAEFPHPTSLLHMQVL